MFCRCRMPQNTISIAAIPKDAAIDPMYSGGPKKLRNKQHIAAVLHLSQKNRHNSPVFL